MTRALASTILFLFLVVGGQSTGAQVAADSARSPGQPAHELCRDPRRWPTCQSYLLFEVAATNRMSGTETTTSGCVLPRSPACLRPDLPGYLAWDVGWMVNRGAARAIGGSLQIGGSEEGVRIALRGRYRAWLAHRMVVDLAAGPLMAQQKGTANEGVHQTSGVTGDVGLGFARIGDLTLGFDAAYQSGHFASSAHAGARLESRGFLVATAAILVGAIAVAQSLRSGLY